MLALNGEFVPFAVNVAASEASETLRPYLPLAERLGRLFTALGRRRRPRRVDVNFEGAIADYDCRVLTLSVLKGLLSPVIDEPVTFVNAPQLAEERGVVVRSTSSPSARDYVNLVTVRGVAGGRPTHVAGTLTASRTRPASSGSTSTSSTCRRRATCSSCATTTYPGVIGMVGSILGDAGVNIDDMDVGPQPERRGGDDGDLHRLAGSRRGRRRDLRSRPGIVDAKAIELG